MDDTPSRELSRRLTTLATEAGHFELARATINPPDRWAAVANAVNTNTSCEFIMADLT